MSLATGAAANCFKHHYRHFVSVKGPFIVVNIVKFVTFVAVLSCICRRAVTGAARRDLAGISELELRVSLKIRSCQSCKYFHIQSGACPSALYGSHNAQPAKPNSGQSLLNLHAPCVVSCSAVKHAPPHMCSRCVQAS